MARPIRIEYPGAFYHVMSRGNESRDIFRSDQDHRRFLGLIAEAAQRWQLSIHAYALMGNHYHLIVEAKGGALSSPMRHINGIYTQYFNHQHKRVGHLFQGRFKALLVEKDAYLLTLSRYIHQNPVKAKLVQAAEGYSWTSYRAFLGLTRPPFWLNTQETLEEFGSDKTIQQKNYKNFVESQQEEDLSKKATGQLVLGSQSFLKTMQNKILSFTKENREFPYQKTLRARVPASIVLEQICEAFGLKREDLAGGRWSHEDYRPLAMALLQKRSGLTLQEIANQFGISYATVSWNIKKLPQKLIKNKNLRDKALVVEKALEKT